MELKILVMSRLLSEGILVYFKLGLILMDMISSKLSLINQQCDFKQMLTYFLEDQINHQIFIEKFHSLYLNGKILMQIRKTMVQNEYKKLRRVEENGKCNHKSPFCTRAKQTLPEEVAVCYSAKNLVNNLKVDHFKPFCTGTLKTCRV